jgi:hypothetical protein
MFLGVALTAAVAYYVSTSETLLNIVFGSRLLFFGLIIGELALVFAITRVVMTLDPNVGLALFFGYAALNGVTLSVIFIAYALGSIFQAFIGAAALFGVMSIIGWTTKQDLSGWGKWLLIGLIGLIVTSIINMFIGSTALEWIISYAGLGLFLALTIYDTNRIKGMTYLSLANGEAGVARRIGVLGALRLYLDFINLFLFLLRIFGRRD